MNGLLIGTTLFTMAMGLILIGVIFHLDAQLKQLTARDQRLETAVMQLTVDLYDSKQRFEDHMLGLGSIEQYFHDHQDLYGDGSEPSDPEEDWDDDPFADNPLRVNDVTTQLGTL